MARGSEATASPSQEGELHPLSLPSTNRLVQRRCSEADEWLSARSRLSLDERGTNALRTRPSATSEQSAEGALARAVAEDVFVIVTLGTLFDVATGES
jgi:hypothetical protein